MTDDERLDVALFRYSIIRPLLATGLEPAVLRALRTEILTATHDIPHSARTRIAERTLRRWLQLYREGGFEGLKPRYRADRGSPRRVDPDVLERAGELRRELPERSIRQLIALLEAGGHAPPGEIRPSTLGRQLRLRGLTRAGIKASSGRVYRRFEAPHRNALWQTDLSYGPYLAAGGDPDKKQRTYLIAFIDDYSRLVPYAGFFLSEQAESLEIAFRQAVLRYGVPERLYVDNGKIFVSRMMQIACAHLGIELVRQTPYRPEGKGKIERFFGTVKQAFYPEAKALGLTSPEQLNELFWAWLEEDYHHQKHHSTGQNPAARFAKDDHPIREVSPEQLVEAFLLRTTRRVTKTATISLEGSTYQVDPAFAGRRIELRYDPHDLSLAYAYDDQGHFIGNAEPVELNRPERPDEGDMPAEGQQAPHTTSYLELLRRRHDQRLRAELRGIPFSRLLKEDTGHV